MMASKQINLSALASEPASASPAPVRVLRPFRPTLDITLVSKEGPILPLLNEIISNMDSCSAETRGTEEAVKYMRTSYPDYTILRIIANHNGYPGSQFNRLDAFSPTFCDDVERKLEQIRLSMLIEGIVLKVVWIY